MSEHWYTRDGRPAYTTNGRDTTLRDARKLGLVKSVTTILNVVSKAALTKWMVTQGIMAALTGTRQAGETDEAYIARILTESKQSAIDAANEGSKIHDACECWFKGKLADAKYANHVGGMLDELKKIFPDVNDWVSEKSFAHPLGFGGKCDLHSPSTGIIVDFKTKDGDFSDGKKLGWDQHWQLAAYQVGLQLERGISGCELSEWFPGAAIFISRTHPGCVASHVWSADEMAQGWSVFAAALELDKRISKFDGSF